MTVKKKQSYIVVLDWMVEKYHLKGNELLAYALIYGFSQDEESEYKGQLLLHLQVAQHRPRYSDPHSE